MTVAFKSYYITCDQDVSGLNDVEKLIRVKYLWDNDESDVWAKDKDVWADDQDVC